MAIPSDLGRHKAWRTPFFTSRKKQRMLFRMVGENGPKQKHE